ncbi:hypothetical protein Tdes44962_MAKER08569 [Teratosphaeria destructans]|uniref:Uncharacterized protein n=1 Tax=Teratosphaeria destructans TaxID=418781 RepID=A0A9W7SW64_9PEZI|nr:hypothetical protein Tdes44962_MAKER08569 [Teratosphaeria destructans]
MNNQAISVPIWIAKFRDKPTEHVTTEPQNSLPPSASTTDLVSSLHQTLEDLEDLFVAIEISWICYASVIRHPGHTTRPVLWLAEQGAIATMLTRTGTDSALLPLVVFHDLTEFMGVEQSKPLDLDVQDAGLTDIKVALLARVGISVSDEIGVEEMLGIDLSLLA